MPEDYYRYTTKARLDKSINTLLGILEGAAADRTVSTSEWGLISAWAAGNQRLADQHPYNELVPRLIQAMADGELSEEELQDITWLCHQLRSTQYYDLVTADIQRLQGMLVGIAADGVITKVEVELLSAWLADHSHLRRCWPFDEVDSLITHAMRDHRIDSGEQKELLAYFRSFGPVELSLDRPLPGQSTVKGVCAVAPEITFSGHKFCFTGESTRATRTQMEALAFDRGGWVVKSVSPVVDYLVVGAAGNPCWAYACYGRKIEQAMQLRREGSKLLIVHEVDFFDAVA